MEGLSYIVESGRWGTWVAGIGEKTIKQFRRLGAGPGYCSEY